MARLAQLTYRTIAATSALWECREPVCIPVKTSVSLKRIRRRGTCSCKRLRGFRLWIKTRSFPTIKSQVSKPLRYHSNTTKLPRNSWCSIRAMGWCCIAERPANDGLLSAYKQLVWHMASAVSRSFRTDSARSCSRYCYGICCWWSEEQGA
jgi:hypothetical protein